MLSGQSIVCFSPNRWDALWRNRQQIMSRLAQQNRVLFVEPAPYLREVTAGGPRVLGVRPRVLGVRGAVHGPHLNSPLPNLWVYGPPTYAPISGRRPLSDLAFAWRRASLRAVLRRLGMTHPILWVFQYNLGEMIGHLHEQLAIYHAVDEYSAYALNETATAEVNRQETIRQMETEVIRQVDLVFVTSPALWESKHSLHPHVVLVPNGVDYEHFACPATEVPADLAELPRPLAGYAGVINEKLDTVLLADIARQHPDWTFALIGPDVLRQQRETLDALQALPNVHFLGSKTVQQLPAYMQSCDVCLMPYRRNEWTRNISPLKLYEYLATGVPIVSTPIPAAQAFAGAIWLADDAPDFGRAIAEAMTSDTPDRRRQQQVLAQPHTWENRLEALSAAIQARLRERSFH